MVVPSNLTMRSPLCFYFLLQRILMVAHSNQALNDLFEKLMERDIAEHHLLRLGAGERELATTKDFSKWGRVNYALTRRLALLAEVERLAVSIGVPAGEYVPCSTRESVQERLAVSIGVPVGEYVPCSTRVPRLVCSVCIGIISSACMDIVIAVCAYCCMCCIRLPACHTTNVTLLRLPDFHLMSAAVFIFLFLPVSLLASARPSFHRCGLHRGDGGVLQLVPHRVSRGAVPR